MFFDDGFKTRGTYCIAMNNFDRESINYFRMILLNKYENETTIHKDNTLYIRAKSKNKFKEIVKKYATKDVLYKLGELLETS